MLTAFAGKAAAHDGGVMHIELDNVGRRPTRITEIQVLEGRLPGLGFAIRRSRSWPMQQTVSRIGRLRSIGNPLDSDIHDPLALDPNGRKKYVLHATDFKQSRDPQARQYTYICAFQKAPRKILARRVRFEGSASSWKEL